MRVKYDKEVDVLLISFSDAKISESDESKSGIIIEYDDKENIVSIEILDASKRVKSPSKVEYEVVV